jgi:hypothetical protein
MKKSIFLLACYFFTIGCKKESTITEKIIQDKEFNIKQGNSSQPFLLTTFPEPVKIDFNYGNAHFDGGCAIQSISGDDIVLRRNVYGPSPVRKDDGFIVRGFRTPAHSFHYGCMVMFTDNIVVNSDRQTRDGNAIQTSKSTGAAISVEYPFLANVTYQISVRTKFIDTRKLVDNVSSDGLPYLYVELKDSPVIPVKDDPCADSGVILLGNTTVINGRTYRDLNSKYYRFAQPESHAQMYRTFVFKFSPTENKNALVISLHPSTVSETDRYKIAINRYIMLLPDIIIEQSEFDPSINTTPGGTGGGSGRPSRL